MNKVSVTYNQSIGYKTCILTLFIISSKNITQDRIHGSYKLKV
jgi:hypothetical protein